MYSLSFLRFLLKALITTACLQTATLLIFVITWKINRDSYLQPIEGELCYTAKRSEFSSLSYKVGPPDNLTEVCGASEYILKLITKAVEERYNSDAYPDINQAFLENKGHCRENNRTLDTINVNSISSYAIPARGQPTKIYWSQGDIQSAGAFCNSTNLESDGFIDIKKTGLYIVSSKLTVAAENGTYDPSYTLEGTHFRHYIKVITGNEREEKTLLVNAMSKCYMYTHESEKVSHIEAVFKLDKEDRVFVATSHPHRIICAPQKDNLFIYEL